MADKEKKEDTKETAGPAPASPSLGKMRQRLETCTTAVSRVFDSLSELMNVSGDLYNEARNSGVDPKLIDDFDSVISTLWNQVTETERVLNDAKGLKLTDLETAFTPPAPQQAIPPPMPMEGPVPSFAPPTMASKKVGQFTHCQRCGQEYDPTVSGSHVICQDCKNPRGQQAKPQKLGATTDVWDVYNGDVVVDEEGDVGEVIDVDYNEDVVLYDIGHDVKSSCCASIHVLVVESSAADFRAQFDTLLSSLRSEGLSNDEIMASVEASHGPAIAHYVIRPMLERGSISRPFKVTGKAPEGWEGTVKKMKEHSEIDNPFALSNYMKNKGDEPHYTEPKKGEEPKKKKGAERAPSAWAMPKTTEDLNTFTPEEIEALRSDDRKAQDRFMLLMEGPLQYIAYQYGLYPGGQYADIAEGNKNLVRTQAWLAAKKFDPTREDAASFKRYIWNAIENAMRNVVNYQKRPEHRKPGDLTPESDLGAEPITVETEEGGEGSYTLDFKTIPYGGASPVSSESERQIATVFQLARPEIERVLSEQELDILTKRITDPETYTMEMIGQELGVTAHQSTVGTRYMQKIYNKIAPYVSAATQLYTDLEHRTAAKVDDALVGQIMAFEAGELAGQAVVMLFSELIKSGMAWTLQGFYGRTARDLIEAGMLDREGNIVNQEAFDALESFDPEVLGSKKQADFGDEHLGEPEHSEEAPRTSVVEEIKKILRTSPLAGSLGEEELEVLAQILAQPTGTWGSLSKTSDFSDASQVAEEGLHTSGGPDVGGSPIVDIISQLRDLLEDGSPESMAMARKLLDAVSAQEEMPREMLSLSSKFAKEGKVGAMKRLASIQKWPFDTNKNWAVSKVDGNLLLERQNEGV